PSPLATPLASAPPAVTSVNPQHKSRSSAPPVAPSETKTSAHLKFSCAADLKRSKNTTQTPELLREKQSSFQQPCRASNAAPRTTVRFVQPGCGFQQPCRASNAAPISWTRAIPRNSPSNSRAGLRMLHQRVEIGWRVDLQSTRLN